MTTLGECAIVVSCLVLGLVPPVAMAEDEIPAYNAGLRVGTSLRGEDIEQADIFVSKKLPWTKSFTCGWNLRSSAELALNILHNDEEDGLSASISTDLHLSSPQHRYFFFSGVGAGALEDSALGDYDFGGPIFFLFHAGAGLQMTHSLSLSYRYAHQSNGHIYINNPSLNLHQLELRYSF
jgi:Lipid A 3-O-deacylase (PagL)